MKKGERIILQPIERDGENTTKRIKNKWADDISYLQDLKGQKTIVIQTLQNEIMTLKEEKRNIEND